MNQNERRTFLIKELLSEQPRYNGIEIPTDVSEQKQLLRSLFNVRMPRAVSGDFIRVQDEYLQEEIRNKGITRLEDLTPIQDGLYLWQGDITTLECDAIVNASNSQMLGCFYPCHGCIDNAIHTFSGIQLRASCSELMQRQGYDEPTGEAKITPAFNLPSKYVIHTVGPIVRGNLTKNHCKLLESCYRSCLEIAVQNNLKSIAFCCISTGEFHFPNDKAGEIAVNTVKSFKAKTGAEIDVIFNVFKNSDYEIYKGILTAN